MATHYTGEELFDCLADLVYFIKNERAEYVVVNQTLVERCGKSKKSQVLGRTTEDVFPPPLGRSYRQQDEAIFRTGEAIVNQLELHLYPGRDKGWCLTNKLPLRRADGKIMGLVGSSQDLHSPAQAAEGYENIAVAMQFARGHLDRRLTIASLAREAGMSAYQFDRRVRSIYRLTTGQMLLKLRLDAAADELRYTDRPIAQIALACGYSDQSAFARQFRQTIGMTPLEYRSTYRQAK